MLWSCCSLRDFVHGHSKTTFGALWSGRKSNWTRDLGVQNLTELYVHSANLLLHSNHVLKPGHGLVLTGNHNHQHFSYTRNVSTNLLHNHTKRKQNFSFHGQLCIQRYNVDCGMCIVLDYIKKENGRAVDINGKQKRRSTVKWSKTITWWNCCIHVNLIFYYAINKLIKKVIRMFGRLVRKRISLH